MIFTLIFIGSSYEEDINPVKTEEQVLEGDAVTLSCNYSGSYASDTLLWYQQYPGSEPEFLLLVTEGGYNKSSHTRHIVRLNEQKTRVDLVISSAEVTDSALYYCALQPTVTGNPETLYKNQTSIHLKTGAKSTEDQMIQN
ncbi:hypothetical protein DPEC_G00063490 [Dallia pectoralis]|uniref:Uncharacterized protein n=1 Tax=Dallia pectoralis TaxID=75939 RepID=A0ACC2H7H2_DALPE|nr:hypothetical protein DPEC_G00063490 [Dallia pectoralis]